MNTTSMSYVSTESGPVVPAKSIPIKMMKNIIADIQGKHCRGESRTDWGDLAKKFNKDAGPHEYTTIQDILKKALTEAAAGSVGQSLFRMDLGNVVCDSAHAKFKMNRKNHSVVVDLLYPNSNGNITMRFNVDDVGEKMFELSLDSEHYINGFGRTLIACCDNAITDAENMTEEPDIYETENGYEPLMASDMRDLRDMAKQLMEADFGAEDFAAAPSDPSGAVPSPDAGSAPATGGDPSTVSSAGTGKSEIGGDLERDDDVVNFADECRANLNTETSLDTSQNGSFNRFTDILGSKMANATRKASSGVILTGKQIVNGTMGIATTMSADERISTFQEYYDQFKGELTKKEMDAFLWWLENNDCHSALEFEAWLRGNPTMRALKERKDAEKGISNSGNNQAENMDALSLPSDNQEISGTGEGQSSGGDMSSFDGGFNEEPSGNIPESTASNIGGVGSIASGISDELNINGEQNPEEPKSEETLQGGTKV